MDTPRINCGGSFLGIFALLFPNFEALSLLSFILCGSTSWLVDADAHAPTLSLLGT